MPCEPIKDQKIIDDMFEALSMRRHGFIYAMYFEFALSTGLRVSDILSLKKKDIFNGLVTIKESKNGNNRSIALNDGCRKRLEAYLSTKRDDDHIFPFKRQWVHKLMKWAADQVGIDASKVSCHTTRKTAGWFFYKDNGNDIVKTQAFLGHRDPKETRVYLMINEDEVNQALVKMSWRKEA